MRHTVLWAASLLAVFLVQGAWALGALGALGALAQGSGAQGVTPPETEDAAPPPGIDAETVALFFEGHWSELGEGSSCAAPRVVLTFLRDAEGWPSLRAYENQQFSYEGFDKVQRVGGDLILSAEDFVRTEHRYRLTEAGRLVHWRWTETDEAGLVTVYIDNGRRLIGMDGEVLVTSQKQPEFERCAQVGAFFPADVVALLAGGIWVEGQSQKACVAGARGVRFTLDGETPFVIDSAIGASPESETEYPLVAARRDREELQVLLQLGTFEGDAVTYRVRSKTRMQIISEMSSAPFLMPASRQLVKCPIP